jgi:hypothetical protein
MNLRVADDSFMPLIKKGIDVMELMKRIQFSCHHGCSVNSAGYERSEECQERVIDLAGRSRCASNAALTGS